MTNFCPNCGYRLADEEPSVLDDYVVKVEAPKVLPVLEEKPKVGVAIPKVSEYKQRFNSHKLRPRDVSVPPTRPDVLPRTDNELDKFGDLFFGDGLQEDF